MSKKRHAATQPRRSAEERAAARHGSVLTRKRQPQREQLAPVVQLPRLGQDTLSPVADADTESSTSRMSTSTHVGMLARWLWRHRWQLTPVATYGATLAGAAAAAPTTTVLLAGTAAGAHGLATRGPNTIGGRAWLSRRERTIASHWSAGGAAWAAAVEFGLWGIDPAGTLALSVLTGKQAMDWVRSRSSTAAVKNVSGDLSGTAADLVAAWPHTIGVHGPGPLRGSHIVAATITEPAPGALTFAVELREDVHGQDAVDDVVRRRIERALSMGIGTVELTTDRNSAALVQVTLTPTRHLEAAPAAWEGPVLNDDGTIPLADERKGTGVDVALFNEAGVEHTAVFGTTGGGKSNTIVGMVLPGVVAGVETLWYIDGGQGTSAGHLTSAADWLGLTAPEWETMIDATHTVMRARKDRRAARGLSAWRGRDEPDPVLTLCIDEATTVVQQISKRHAAMVSEILREGRKLGVRIIQCTQDPEGTGLIGGRQARGLMAGGGSLIAHRMGDGTANVLAAGSTAESVDLRNLPPEPGWVAIIRRGRVLTRAARVRYATPDAVSEVLADVAPRPLAAADLDAAGDAYSSRVTGPAMAARMRGDEPDVEAHAAAQPPPPNADIDPARDESTGGAEVVDFPAAAVTAAMTATDGHSRTVVLATIREHPGGITPVELRRLTGLSKTSANRYVRALVDEGVVGRDTNTGITRPIDSQAA